MTLRAYDFTTGVETSTSPVPTDPSANTDVMTKGYADTTYAKRASWYDAQSTNAGIKAIAVADRANGQIVYQSTTDMFYTFDSGSSAADDGSTILAPDTGTGRWLQTGGAGGAAGNTLVQEYDEQASGITAAETLTANNLVCMEIHNGTGSNVHRYFKADNDDPTRRSVKGFSKSAATVTPEISTYTISAAFVAGNVIATTFNGRAYSHTYASSSDATLQAIATSLAADVDVTSATVSVQGGNQTGTDDRTITITAKGGRSFTCSATVTSGASQPTVTVTQTQAGSGDTVDLHEYGPLGGFSAMSIDGGTGLVVGNRYHASNTAGAITSNPPAGAIFVGVAISTDYLDVRLTNSLPGSASSFIRHHGNTGVGDDTAASVGTTCHFDFATWITATTADTSLYQGGGIGESRLLGKTWWIDGLNSAAAQTAVVRQYDKSTWTAGAATRANNRAEFGIATLESLNVIVAMKGRDSGGTATNTISHWDGTSWSNPANTGSSCRSTAMFFQGSSVHAIGGNEGGVATNKRDRWDGSTNTQTTDYPISDLTTIGSRSFGSSGWAGGGSSSSTASYKFDGTNWSTSITLANGVRFNAVNSSTWDGCNACGYNSDTGTAYVSGGVDGSNNARAQTQSFNGTTVAASVSAPSAIHDAMGGVI